MVPARARHGDRAGGAWWCPLTRTRALVVGEPARWRLGERWRPRRARRADVVEVTTIFAALTLAGPLAREVFARFCALDLRPAVTPVGALRPGSIARQPGILICEAEDRYLFLFGWATAEYMWSVVADAGAHLGGRPIGVDALAADRGSADRAGGLACLTSSASAGCGAAGSELKRLL